MHLMLGLALAVAATYGVTPVAIRIADRLQFYDKPVGYKGHARPTPYLGGAAVMSGFVLAMLLAAGDWRKTVPLVGGVALLWTVGTIDDRRTVSPVVRVVTEIVLAAVIWASGLGWDLHLGGAVDLALTCLWVLAVVNAFNLFDNMDGAASTMALVVSAGAALIGVVRRDAWLAVGAASLGGACLGFLPRNLSPPARIFLGDGGSMPLGFAVAVLVMAAASTSPVAWQSLLVALLLVGIPALDTSLVIVSRRRRGVSILTGGQDHLTHRTRRFLPSARAVALSLGAIQAVVSVVAVLASKGGTSFLVISAILYVLAAAGAIVLLEGQKVEEFGTHADPATCETQTPGDSRAGSACLALLGLGAGLSPFFFAYYDASAWVPIGLGLVTASAVAVVARPMRPTGPTALALGSVLGLGVWSLTSTAWTESVENAVVSGNRWLAYGALLLLMLMLVRSDRRSSVLMGAATLGVGIVALSVLVRLLGSDPGALFLGGRLNSPLGYINGEGCLFVIGFWLCFAAAEARRAPVAALAGGMATLMACLAILSQSRGTALAMLAALVAVVAVVPGRTRRVYGLLVVAGAVALTAPDLLRVYEHAAGGSVSVETGHVAGRATLLASAAASLTWGLLTLGWELVVSRRPWASRTRTAGSWLLAIPILVALVVTAGSAQRIDRGVRDQWHAFTLLAEPGAVGGASSASQSRLVSGAGNRYDYWRIAWRVWHEHPMLGVGAGNYPRPYYQQRATTEDIEQPHSVELQVLSELGVVGVLLLAGFIGGICWGISRMRPAAVRSPLSRALMVGGVGAIGAWLAQASVDWMHLLPGLTAIAIAATAIAVRPRSPQTRGAVSRHSRFGAALASRPALALGASAVLVTLVVAGASLSRQGLADIYRTRAQQELDAHPAAAITDANRSLNIDADAVETYYVKAAALARFDQAAAAQAVLRQALEHEPNNFVTWTLLGDIALRERRIGAAKRDYARAHELNPRNVTLRALVVHPSTGLR